MSARSRVRLLLSVLSLGFAFACGELAVRALQRLGRLPHYSAALFASPNARLNARLVRSENPRLALEFDRRDPNVNAVGHRGRDFPVEKAPQTYRIAVLGDSVAYGYSVPLHEVFTTLLEERLRGAAGDGRFEVLNFAVSGYGTEAELELYDTKVRRYRPDLVLLAYVLNDPIPPRLLGVMDDAARRSAARFGRISAVSQLGAGVFLGWEALTARRRARWNYDVFYHDPASWGAVQDSVRGLAERGRRDGFALVAVVFPLLLDFEAYPVQEYHERIAAEFERNGIPHLDLLDAYRRAGAETLRIQPRDDSHPNARGHAIAAQEIERFLVGIGALPGRSSQAPTRGEGAGR